MYCEPESGLAVTREERCRPETAALGLELGLGLGLMLRSGSGGAELAGRARAGERRWAPTSRAVAKLYKLVAQVSMPNR